MNRHFISYSLLLIALMFSACNNALDVPVSGTSNATIQKCSDAAEAEQTPLEYVRQYYESYSIEDKEAHPYTYIMNKYLDLALAYFDSWNEDVFEYDIVSKQRILNEKAALHYTLEYLEDTDLESTEEDTFFSDLYNQLCLELNEFSVIQNYLSISDGVVDDEDIILPLYGETAYSKLDILYSAENDIALEHEQYNTDEYTEEDDDCNCNSYSPSNPHSGVQRLVKYDLLSKWLTDIRYRNYKKRCPNMNTMREAMNEWEEAAQHAIRFVEIKDNGWNRFTWGIGCDYHVCISNNCSDDACGVSSLGAVPWAFVHINPDCTDKGTCLHELGHTLTLQHEQCRPDRDCYITVHFENMDGKHKAQFHKFLESSVTAYGPFDFESIMLYDSWAFTNNGQPTITKKEDGSTFWGQTNQLSEGDKLYIRNIYY